MDKNGKSRHSVWLSDDVWREVDALYKLDNCPTRNEFVEKALRQYCGRLHAERTGAYLPRALQEVLEGTLGVFGDRLGRLLFKLVVEHNMTNHLLGGDVDMTRDEYSKMRGSSVREVAATHGNISFKDKLVQELLEPSGVRGKNWFSLLMDRLPETHKARWFAGAALNSSEQAMASVMSTVLSRLNAFLDSELEQVLCFDSAIKVRSLCPGIVPLTGDG